ncbi:MAG: hypothetical protein ACODAJ_15800, partial [Planctomycetota bacterium]
MFRAPLMLCALLPIPATAAEVVTVLNTFDSAEAIDRFCGHVRHTYVQKVSEPRREGEGACKIDFLMHPGSDGPAYVRAYYSRGDLPYGNWTPYQNLRCDLRQDGDAPLPLHLVIRDGANKTFDHALTLPPGQWQTVEVPVAKLEAAGLAVHHIERIQIEQRPDEVARPNSVVLDHLRLVGADAQAIAAARAEEDQTADQRTRPYPAVMPTRGLVPELEAAETIRQVRQVPVTHETEVIVVGGGMAGVA